MSLSLVGRNSRQTGHAESIDHFFGTDQKRVWNLDAERLVGLHVDDQLELVGLLDREVARLGALPNLLHIAGQRAGTCQRDSGRTRSNHPLRYGCKILRQTEDG